MVSVHPSLEVVYIVVAAIPLLGAMPGDEIILRPSDPDFPVELRRTFPLESFAAIPEASLRMLAGVAASVAPAPASRDRLVPALTRGVLRLAV